MIKRVIVVAVMFLIGLCCTAEVKRVACVGDSITFGAGVKNRAENCYPAQLQKLLGSDYQVRNFGNSGSTMLKKDLWSEWGRVVGLPEPDYIEVEPISQACVILFQL